VHWGRGPIRKASKFDSILLGVVKRREETIATILLADTTGVFEFRVLPVELLVTE
jgi:hypothetical protein